METIKRTTNPGRFAGHIAIFAVAFMISTLIMACGGNEPPPAPEPAPTSAVATAPEPTHTPAPPPPTETPAPTDVPEAAVAPTEAPPEPTEPPEPTVPAPEPTPMSEATQAPAPTTAPRPTLNLGGVWWERKQTGDTTPAWVYEEHPHALALDLLDGWTNYHPEYLHLHFREAEEAYPKIVLGSGAIRAIGQKLLDLEGRGGGRDIKGKFAETAGWEVTDIEHAEVRYWATVKGNYPANQEYRVGFTVRWKTDQPMPALLADRIKSSSPEYPTDKFLDHPTLVGDVILEPIE